MMYKVNHIWLFFCRYRGLPAHKKNPYQWPSRMSNT